MFEDLFAVIQAICISVSNVRVGAIGIKFNKILNVVIVGICINRASASISLVYENSRAGLVSVVDSNTIRI